MRLPQILWIGWSMNKARRILIQAMVQFLVLIDTQVDSVSYVNKAKYKKLRDARRMISDSRSLMVEWLNETIDDLED